MSHTSESYSVCLAIWWPGPCCWDGKLTSSGSGALVPIFRSFNLLALPLICLDWDTSCSSGSSCLCFLFVCASQLSGCRPDGVLVMPIEGRGRHLDPKQIPPKDRDIHLVEFKFCSDINPQQTLEKAHNQHQPLIQRLRTRSLRGISRNNKVTLHVILLGVGGTIYNQYTITPLLNLGIPTHKVHQLATQLHCHANKKLKQDHKNKTQNTL